MRVAGLGIRLLPSTKVDGADLGESVKIGGMVGKKPSWILHVLLFLLLAVAAVLVMRTFWTGELPLYGRGGMLDFHGRPAYVAAAGFLGMIIGYAARVWGNPQAGGWRFGLMTIGLMGGLLLLVVAALMSLGT
jgi:hypothetical protein